MAARKKLERCGECGAVLQTGPASCPLCGTEYGAEPMGDSKVKPAATNSDDYQAKVRELRKQLSELRKDAEAV